MRSIAEDKILHEVRISDDDDHDDVVVVVDNNRFIIKMSKRPQQTLHILFCTAYSCLIFWRSPD